MEPGQAHDFPSPPYPGDELSSLIRALTEQSSKLAERVALLEGQRAESKQHSDIDIERSEDTKEHTPCAKEVAKGIGIDETDITVRLSMIEEQIRNHDDVKDRNTPLDSKKYRLSESTFSLLITEHPCSFPFMFAIFTAFLSLTCLVLTLAGSVSKRTSLNPLGVPIGVSGIVRAAQFFGKFRVAISYYQ